MAYYVTINIESKGTPRSDGGKSKAGHMWYSLKDSSTNDVSDYGFTNEDADGDGNKDVSNTDRDDYEGDPAYSRTVEVTKEQYDAMKKFGLKGRTLPLFSESKGNNLGSVPLLPQSTRST